MFECPRRAESNLVPEQLEDNAGVKLLFLYVINNKHTIALVCFVSLGGLITRVQTLVLLQRRAKHPEHIVFGCDDRQAQLRLTSSALYCAIHGGLLHV
jgi:hypothetical protein